MFSFFIFFKHLNARFVIKINKETTQVFHTFAKVLSLVRLIHSFSHIHIFLSSCLLELSIFLCQEFYGILFRGTVWEQKLLLKKLIH